MMIYDGCRSSLPQDENDLLSRACLVAYVDAGHVNISVCMYLAVYMQVMVQRHDAKFSLCDVCLQAWHQDFFETL